MTAPTRLRESGSETVRALLGAAPRTRPLSPDERAHSRARVARATAGIAAGVGALAYLQGAAIGAGLGLLAVGVAEVLPGRLTAAPPGQERVTSPRVAPGAPVRVPSARATDAPTPAVSAVPAAPAARSVPRSSASAGDPAEPPAPADSLAEEAALLERARVALAQSPATALALTQAHAARFPAGKLATERELLAIDALGRLGRAGEARARGEALLSGGRGGLYEERIHKLLDALR